MNRSRFRVRVRFWQKLEALHEPRGGAARKFRNVEYDQLRQRFKKERMPTVEAICLRPPITLHVKQNGQRVPDHLVAANDHNGADDGGGSSAWAPARRNCH